MTKASAALRDALKATGLVEPVQFEGKAGSVSCLCRQLPGKEAPWIAVIDSLLAFAEENNVKIHLCRRYVRKSGGLVFGWFVGIESTSARGVAEDVDKVLSALKNVKPVPVPIPSRVQTPKPPQKGTGIVLAPTKNGTMEVSEFPIPFVSKDLNVPNKKEKGARYIGGSN